MCRTKVHHRPTMWTEHAPEVRSSSESLSDSVMYSVFSRAKSARKVAHVCPVWMYVWMPSAYTLTSDGHIGLEARLRRVGGSSASHRGAGGLDDAVGGHLDVLAQRLHPRVSFYHGLEGKLIRATAACDGEGLIA